MQYSLPQFVEVEDKIIGPFTLKQFLILLGGGLLCFIYWSIFKLGIFFFALAVPTILGFLIIAFAKFNGRSLLANFPFLVQFFLTPRVRVFRRVSYLDSVRKQVKKVLRDAPIHETGEKVRSRLRELAYILDQKSAEEERLIHSKELPKKWLNEI